MLFPYTLQTQVGAVLLFDLTRSRRWLPYGLWKFQVHDDGFCKAEFESADFLVTRWLSKN